MVESCLRGHSDDAMIGPTWQPDGARSGTYGAACLVAQNGAAALQMRISTQWPLLDRNWPKRPVRAKRDKDAAFKHAICMRASELDGNAIWRPGFPPWSTDVTSRALFWCVTTIRLTRGLASEPVRRPADGAQSWRGRHTLIDGDRDVDPASAFDCWSSLVA
jgi:hypothetical protein